MSTSNSVHSNALNFVGFVDNGVDPRTGQYTVSINLPDMAANNLRGPDVKLSLAFNPLNNQDLGFGTGWELALTQYNPRNNVIALSTGETFKVTGTSSSSDRLQMKEQKLDSFHLHDLKDTPSEFSYRVVHKSGTVEWLKPQGSTQNRLHVPARIQSPAGHWVELVYTTHDGHPMLKSIKDADGNILLSVEHTSSQVALLVQPYASDEPLARFVMVLRDTPRRVARIELPTDNQASWRFEYAMIRNHLCIVKVQTPTGAHESVSYGDNGDAGHAFPSGSGRTALPRVTRHVLDPGSGQAPVDVRYRYQLSHGNTNFLGAGLNITWADDGLDNLYKYIGDYAYQSVESLYIEGAPVRRIERTFNQFHLQTLQTTVQGNAVYSTETTYHLLQNVAYDKQPSICQIPRTVTTRWRLANDPTLIRSETVETTFDVHGNLLTQRQPDGVLETSTWYPADGAEDGCPPDPEGFVRHLKSRTVTPAPAATAAPVLCSRYRYLALPALADSGLPDFVTRESETLVQLDLDDETEQQLHYTLFSYLNAPGNPFEHGRISRTTETLNGCSTFTDTLWRTLEQPLLGIPVVESSETISSDFDTSARTVVRQHSSWTGQEVSTLIDDVQNLYRYDSLGRLVEEVVAAQTAYQARRTYTYQLCAQAGDQAGQRVWDARQVMTHTLLDGLGRAILKERDHVDSTHPAATQLLMQASHDAWGHLSQQTDYDWLDGQPLALTRHYDYDTWGERCCETGPDGVGHYLQTDPIGTPESSVPVQRSWLQSPGTNGLVSELSETWLNLFGKPDRIRSLAPDGRETSARHFIYDGLGRCVEQHDELNRMTRFEYDPWSRLIETQLPDNTRVQRRYAAHSTADLPTEVLVGDASGTFVTVGTQRFDALQRLTESSVGPRTDQYFYEPGRRQACQRLTAGGATLDYEYNLQLTDEPTLIHARREDDALQAGFTYDPVSARLTHVGNELGQREYDYNLDNQLTDEHWVDSNGTRWSSSFVTSLQGRPLRRTELIQEARPGLETHHEYDRLGRLERLEQGNLRTTLEYNTLGQLLRTTTRDLTAFTTLVLEQAYDEHGRETCRTVDMTGQPRQTLEQHWQADGLLLSRCWRQDTLTVLDETFEYDSRGRLGSHTCTGEQLPRDDLGRAYTQQIFTFDALDNLKTVRTNFTPGSTPAVELAQYVYDAVVPCQLNEIKYTPARASGYPTFRYDADGNQLNDRLGRQLHYDLQGRLTAVEHPDGQAVAAYGYDGHNHLVNATQGAEAPTLRFYQDDALSCAVRQGIASQWLHGPQGVLGQQQSHDPDQTLLALTDANGNLRAEYQQGDERRAVYSAYGQRHSDEPLLSLSGYNGEMLDSATGWYLLGKGYRAYDPALMRFHSPDSLSPFGSGGLNPYTYCLGNPIALHDPTGHFASSTSSRTRIRHDDVGPEESKGGGFPWLIAAIGAVTIALSVAATVVTLGAAFPATAGSIAGTTSAVGASAAATAGSVAGATAGTMTAASIAAAANAAGVGAGVAAGAGTAATVGSTAAIINASISSTSTALTATTTIARTLGSHAAWVRLAEYVDLALMPMDVMGGITASRAAVRAAKRGTSSTSSLLSTVPALQSLRPKPANVLRQTPVYLPDAPARRTSASSISDSLPDSLPVSRRSSVAESAAGSTGSAHPAIPENPAEAVPNQTVRGPDFNAYRGWGERRF